MTDHAIDKLLQNLDHAMIADRHCLRRQLHELRKRPDEAKLAQWVEKVQASCAQVTARQQSVPTVRYDDNLPIAAKRDEIKKALAENQVLVIAGMKPALARRPSCRKSAWSLAVAAMG